MATATGSITGSVVGIRPRFFDSYAVQSRSDTPGLSDIATTITTSDRISEEDIYRHMSYVVDWKVVKNNCTDLLGMLMSQSFTEEHSDTLNQFEFKYLVDRTGGAREEGYNTGAPVVTLDMVTRKVRLTNARCVCIVIPKSLYRRMLTCLQELSGLNDRERAIKPYMGEQGPILMTPAWRAEVRNYMEALKVRTDVALNSQNQGTNEAQLEFLYVCAPDLKMTPMKDSVIPHDNIRLVLPNMLRSFLEHSFFINKIMGMHLKKKNLGQALSRLYRVFKLNTSENLMPELAPRWENTTFNRATGIITCTNNIRDQFISMGLVTHHPNAVMIKTLSYCKVGAEDLHPFDTLAPHKMVQQVDVGNFKQTEEGSLRKVEKRVETPCDVLHAPEGNFVLNVVTEANFGNQNALSRIGLRSTFRYDEMLPVGVVVDVGRHDDSFRIHNELKIVPQTTYYTDHHGITRGISISQSTSWIVKIEDWYYGKHLSTDFTDRFNNLTRWDAAGTPPLLFGYIDAQGLYTHHMYSSDNKFFTDEILLTNCLNYLRKSDGFVIAPARAGQVFDAQRFAYVKQVLVDKYSVPRIDAIRALETVTKIKNKHLAMHMVQWDFNPGLAIVYVREVACESEGIMISRPGAAHLITAPHEMERRGDMSDMGNEIKFNMKQRHAHAVCGLGNTSVKLGGAFNVNRIGIETSSVHDPLDNKFKRDIQFSSQSRDYSGGLLPEKEPRWWPVLWGIHVEPGFFDGACSPFGRSPVPFDSQNEFTANFMNTDIMDIQFQNKFSINSFFHPHGPNTVGYDLDMQNHAKCPHKKYLNFSSERRAALGEAQTHQKRLSQMNGGGLGRDGSEVDMTMPRYLSANNMSVCIGAAMVKRCFTTQGLLNAEGQNRFPSINPGNHLITDDKKFGNHFFYPGNTAFEILDIGVAESSVT